MPENSTSGIASQDQERGRHAWDLVQRVMNDPKLNGADKKEFGLQAKKLPTRIMAAGLGHALAFLEGKKYAPDLREGLANWIDLLRKTNGDNRLFVRIIQEDADFQRWATGECLAYLRWLVRFADAEGLTKGTQE